MGDAVILTKVVEDGEFVEAALTEEDMALVRYNWDGSIDTTFNTGGAYGDGKVVTDIREGFDRAIDVAIMEDEDDQYKIVVVGVSADPTDTVLVDAEGRITTDEELGNPREQEDFALARYNLDGSIDASFGTDGIVLTDFAGLNELNEAAAAVVIMGNDIFVAGTTTSPHGTGEDWAMAVYDSEIDDN